MVNALATNLDALGYGVTVTAHTVRMEPPSGIRVIETAPSEFSKLVEDHDVTHIHLSYPFIKAAVKDNISPYLLTHHGYTPWHLVPGFSNKIVHLGLRWAYQNLLHKVPLMTAVSGYVQDQLYELYGLRPPIIPNGVEDIFFEPEDDLNLDGDPVIFNSTGWNWQKGVDLLVRDFAAIKRVNPEARLYVVTTEHNRSPLLKHVEKFKVKDSVTALPYLDLETLSKYYRSADIYLLTSRWESFGLPIIESFASETPVLAREIKDARRDHIESSGGGLLYGDRAELVSGLRSILAERSVFSGRAKKYAHQFRWGDIVERYLQLYQRMLNDKAPHTNPLGLSI